MATFSRKELLGLLEIPDEPVVSMYLPTYPAGDMEQDRIRFKKLLKKGEKWLIQKGTRTPDARQLLEPANELLCNDDFWIHQSDGLALFLSPKTFRYYHFPYEFRETLEIGNCCYIKPLLPLLHDGGMFYVLALSQNMVRLFQCTKYSQQEITPDNIPKNIAEALKYDHPEKQLQLHTTGPGPAIFHGQGATKDNEKNILRYFQQIDRGLHTVLREENAPLIVAAVDYLYPLFKEANTYGYLADEVITGNPDDIDATGLREMAWKFVEPYFTQQQQKVLSEYKMASSKGLTLTDVKDVVLAAFDGRISVLFVDIGLKQSGIFDREKRIIRLIKGRKNDKEDLLEVATVYTLLKGGDIYPLPSGDISNDSPTAAILRF